MKLRIISNDNLCGDVFRLKAERGGMPGAEPGQFIHVRCSGSSHPLLRRPFSIAGMDEEALEIIYRAAGKGTQLLSRAEPGSFLDAIGPLGRGFPPDSYAGKALLAAGGMGAAPLLFLARKHPGSVKKFIYGASTSQELLCLGELSSLGIDVISATDDGTCGVKGTACSALEDFFSGETVTAALACGPFEMLREVCRLAAGKGTRCFVSLESRMACGVGACLGCAVKILEGGQTRYRRVCRDGPVFKGETVVWEDPIFP